MAQVLAESKSAKGAATRDQILDAASRLTHLQGYHCTSLDDVLRESGVGKGNFYYHFRSKEELGQAIIERLVHAFRARTLEPAFADSDLDPVEQIEHFLDRVLDNQRQRNCIGGCPMGNLRLLREGMNGEACGPTATRTAQRKSLVAALEGAILMTKVTKDIAVMEKCVAELKHHLTLYAKI